MNTVKLIGLRRAARRKAIGLIEIAMGLGIAALIIAGALAYLGNANMGRQVNDAMSQVAGIQQVVRSLTSGQSDYNGINAAVVGQSRQLPNRYIVGNPATGLTSAFNGPVTVTPQNTDQQFDIVMANVPRDACSRLATADMGTGMLAVGVGATAAAASAQIVARLASNPSQAYTAAAANAACAAAVNAVGWRFN